MHSLKQSDESNHTEFEMQWDELPTRPAIKYRDMSFKSWTCFNFTWLSKHVALLCETRVQRW